MENEANSQKKNMIDLLKFIADYFSVENYLKDTLTPNVKNAGMRSALTPVWRL
jgi:hypothetical protein